MSNEVPAILLLEADSVTGELYERELGRYYRVFRCQDEGEAFQLLDTMDILRGAATEKCTGKDGCLFDQVILSAGVQ